MFMVIDLKKNGALMFKWASRVQKTEVFKKV